MKIVVIARWGMREFGIRTPDGPRIMFGQEIQPLERDAEQLVGPERQERVSHGYFQCRLRASPLPITYRIILPPRADEPPSCNRAPRVFILLPTST